MEQENKEPSMEEMKAKLDEYTNHLKRLQAEFENYQKRTDKERHQVSQYASERVITKILTIVDDFDRAVESIKDEKDREGVSMIAKELHKLLDEEGVKPIEAVGQVLDTTRHEVMLIEEGEEDGRVLEELQKGYTMHDKVIRYSKVKVCKHGGKHNE